MAPGVTYNPVVARARGIAILFVIMGHFDVPGMNPGYWILIRDVIYRFHMPLFMMLSGYLFAYTSTAAQRMSGADYLPFIRSKAERLLIPYLALSILIAAAKVVAGHFFTLKFPLNHNAWKYLLLNPMRYTAGQPAGYAGMLWFIYTLFLIFALYPWLLRLCRRQFVLIPLLAALSLLHWPRVFCLNYFFLHLPYFAVGAALGRVTRLQEDFPRPLLGWGLAASVGLFTAFFIAPPLCGLENLRPMALALSGSFATLCLAALLPSGRVTRAIEKTGMYSFEVYLLHTLAAGASTIFLFQVLKWPPGAFLPAAGISIILGAVLPVLAGQYVLRPHRWLSWLVLGVRKKPEKETVER